MYVTPCGFCSCFFLWSHGRQREQLPVIWSCNFHVFTFISAFPVSLIALAPTFCDAFSHFVPLSLSPLLFCAFMHCQMETSPFCHATPSLWHAVKSQLPPVSQLRDQVLWLCEVVGVYFTYLVLFFQLCLGTYIYLKQIAG